MCCSTGATAPSWAEEETSSEETQHSVCLLMSLCFCRFFYSTVQADPECVNRSHYKKFLLSSPRVTNKEKSLGHFQNDFHCCISAFGRMQPGPCQWCKEINDPRVRAWSAPIKVWLEEHCRSSLSRGPCRDNGRIWNSGENCVRWRRRRSLNTRA